MSDLLCLSCSNYLGEVLEAYDCAVKGLVIKTKNSKEEYKRINPENFDKKKIPSVGFILDTLVGKNICCRSQLMSYINIDRFPYKNNF